jgi:ankyrin repeat protein
MSPIQRAAVTVADNLMSDGSPKSNSFSMKQLMGRHGSIMMAAVERLLSSTCIDAKDIETKQTLLEYACRNSNIALAKFCCRQGSNLAGLFSDGDTALNIASQKKCYDLMFYLISSGMPVNQGDAKGRTALHVAVQGDDVDGICRLLEWGAYINSRDSEGRTPLHYAAIRGNMSVAELLLELGANLNAVDAKDYSAVTHAEANDHFKLMDRLQQLGGKGGSPGAIQVVKGGLDEMKEVTAKNVPLGALTVKPVYLAKASSLARLAKFRKPNAIGIRPKLGIIASI